MNSGPRPSEACVDAGADTHSLRNSPLPTWKRWRPSAEGCEKISALSSFLTVAAPACMVSNDSAAEKSAVGAVMACTRARSSADRSVRPGAAAPTPCASAASTTTSADFT
ncbi:Uncharacterised protein [Bordetella pertussis]|nr:Uncharacterised protein [Bordetella pertussis]